MSSVDAGVDRADRGFHAALEQIDGWLVPGGVPGVGAAVWHRGRIAAERYAGEARPGVDVQPDTIFPLASVTKPVTAAVIMSLVEDGLVSLDEPVVSVLPEFALRPEDSNRSPHDVHRGSVTVRQLLSHASGLPEDVGSREIRYADGPSLEALTDTLIRLPIQSPPGQVVRYSNAGYAALARLTEHLTGQEFWQLAKERILGSPELDEIYVRPTTDLEQRIAILADSLHPGTPYETYNSPYWRDLALPWGGLYGTPRALVRFAAAFLPGSAAAFGLASPTSALMRSDQACGVPGGVESGRVAWPVASWGLGWEVKGAKRHHWTGDLSSAASYCHFGQAGTLLWADPARDLALAVFANRAVTRMWTFILGRWIRLNNAVIAAADDPFSS